MAKLTDKQKRFCERCKADKDESDFSITSTTKKGKVYRYVRATCKACDSKRATDQGKLKRKGNPELARKIAQEKYIKQVESGWINYYRKKYYSENRESIKDYRKSLAIRNPQFAEILKIRSKLYHFLNGTMKSAPFEKLIGCNLNQLRIHIESGFKEGMSWDNRNLWHVDHRVPLSAFDLLDAQDLKRSCHYTNLQPLWAADNIRKGGYRRNFSHDN